MNVNEPIALIVLDGFGSQNNSSHNAITLANTPHLDRWLQEYPHTILQASGTAVGLLEHYMGNSEVGHYTIGAGRVVKQPATIIHEAIENGTLAHNSTINELFSELAQAGTSLHLIGLLSDACVHSNQELLYALIDMAKQHHIKQIHIHPILDGRDVAPQSANSYLTTLDNYIKKNPNVIIGSLHGRYYAMDRDNNNERTKQTLEPLLHKTVNETQSWQTALQKYYSEGITDEFVPPTQLNSHSIIHKGDGIIIFNFRPDRSRQLTQQLLDYQTKVPFAFLVTPFSFSSQIKTTTIFTHQPIQNCLMDILHQHHKQVMAIAETEKYAHVTYFFNCSREASYENEEQILVPSLKMKNYIEAPEMSAPMITKHVIASLQNHPKDFYLINYANADMVGHSGNLEATIQAVECLDKELAVLYQQIVVNMNGTMIITGDHGKAEEMFDQQTQQPKTAHTSNPVPFIVIKQNAKDSNVQLPLYTLADIAPYILTLMQLPVPQEMRHK